MKTLKQYSEELKSSIGQPGKIADLEIEIASDYASLTDELIKLEINKSLFFDTTKFSTEKPLSDQAVLYKYQRTPEGERYMIIKLTLKALEKLKGACSNHTFVKNKENQGQW